MPKRSPSLSMNWIFPVDSSSQAQLQLYLMPRVRTGMEIFYWQQMMLVGSCLHHSYREINLGFK